MSEVEIYKGMIKKMKLSDNKPYLKKIEENSKYLLNSKLISDTEWEEYQTLKKQVKMADYITNLQQENEQLRTQVNTYENPDDLTLFYMWLDEKAKDKMRHMENEIIQLKQFNQMLTEMGEDYKSRCEKANNFIEENWISYKDSKDFKEFDEVLEVFIKEINELYNILNGRSDE